MLTLAAEIREHSQSPFGVNGLSGIKGGAGEKLGGSKPKTSAHLWLVPPAAETPKIMALSGSRFDLCPSDSFEQQSKLLLTRRYKMGRPTGLEPPFTEQPKSFAERALSCL